MAANLVSVVMQFLTPDMIAKIASALGIDRTVAQKAIGGAVPALLAGLADLASTSSGARQLTNTLAQQQPGALESLKSLIGSSGQKNLAETGSSMLSGLFGGAALDTMAQSIGKFAGLDGGASKSLLGMLGPREPPARLEQRFRDRSRARPTPGVASTFSHIWLIAGVAAAKRRGQDDRYRGQARATVTTSDVGSTLGALVPIEQTNDKPSLVPEKWRSPRSVLCIPGSTKLDEAAALVLAQIMRRRGFGAAAEKADALSMSKFFSLDLTDPSIVCVCYVDRPSSAKIQYAVRRLAKKNSNAGILLAFLGTDNATPVESASGAHVAKGSFEDVLAALIRATSEQGCEATIDTKDIVAR